MFAITVAAECTCIKIHMHVCMYIGCPLARGINYFDILREMDSILLAACCFSRS